MDRMLYEELLVAEGSLVQVKQLSNTSRDDCMMWAYNRASSFMTGESPKHSGHLKALPRKVDDRKSPIR
jgi:hypothetical protein